MLPIPAAIETLLKSKQMVGENRPTGYIKLGNQPNNYDMLAPTTWTTWRTFVSGGRGHGNMTETSDGRAVISYVESGAVKIAFSGTVVGILDGSETFATGAANTVVASGAARTSLTLLNNKLNLIIIFEDSSTKVFRAELWRDADGKGASFSKVCDIDIDLGTNAWGYPTPSIIHELDNGNWVCLLPYVHMPRALYSPTSVQAHISTDKGETWVEGAYLPISDLDRVPIAGSLSFLIVDESSFITSWLASTSSNYLCLWTNSGAAVSATGWGSGWSGAYGDQYDYPGYTAFVTVGNKSYMARYSTNVYVDVAELNDSVISIDNMKDPADWTGVFNHPTDWANREHNFTLTTKALILQHSDSSMISGAGTEVISHRLRPKSITIDRSKGSASQATVVLDNKGGQYAPDPAGIWHEVIWPNAELEVYLGYGAVQQLVFSGLLDDLTMSNYPAEISFTARDYSKWALDQMVQDSGVYSITYTNQTPEYIFNDLATKAGFTDITTDTSGLTIAEITFANEQYGDAFQRLAEMCGFEWFCDEAGALFFRLAVEPTPVAAYSFVEGVDIFSLDYTISDTELYYKVVVVSQDADGNTVSGSADYAGKDAYDVLAQKIMIIQATDLASTAEQCATLAATAAAAIKPKPRQVGFVVVGHPYLQIGDCIQVTETTSTISEIYRIFELTHQMDASGSPVFATTIKCYHYAAA